MTVKTQDLAERHCAPCEGGVPPLSAEQVRAYQAAVPDWQLAEDGKGIKPTPARMFKATTTLLIE